MARRNSGRRKDIQVITHAANQGYGQSLIDAFNYADSRGYDWVITMDCDEQHEPEMIPVHRRDRNRPLGPDQRLEISRTTQG
jgi:glycosyltransferase involved in cell wall biosynthesis